MKAWVYKVKSEEEVRQHNLEYAVRQFSSIEKLKKNAKMLLDTAMKFQNKVLIVEKERTVAERLLAYIKQWMWTKAWVYKVKSEEEVRQHNLEYAARQFSSIEKLQKNAKMLLDTAMKLQNKVTVMSVVLILLWAWVYKVKSEEEVRQHNLEYAVRQFSSIEKLKKNAKMLLDTAMKFQNKVQYHLY
ncbi:hypothetical protein TSAR_007598 [Trichomalopsis sarcophagae]|uniref:Uncharacterized protein n=1 Tax=Trichomalopsis sarcophagae TaxID=543379 RepID=A0A232EQP9_9HYME|nr:hypothetical protein TSAR_007598 [Trichomalopsis sarcophagae]